MFSFSYTSCIENEQPKNALAKNVHDRFPSLTVKRLPRRLLLQFMGFNPILLCVYPGIAAPMPEMKEPEVIRWNILCVQWFFFFLLHTHTYKLESYSQAWKAEVCHEISFFKTVWVLICDYYLGFEASRTFKLASGVKIQGIKLERSHIIYYDWERYSV